MYYCQIGQPADHTCTICRRCAVDAAFRAFILTVPPPGKAARATLTPLPCRDVGSPAPPPDRQSTNRKWHHCDHPKKPLGDVVCFCRGCGPKCTGYSADESAGGPPEGADRPHPVQ